MNQTLRYMLLYCGLLAPAVSAQDLIDPALPAGRLRLEGDRRGHVYLAVAGDRGFLRRYLAGSSNDNKSPQPTTMAKGDIQALQVLPTGEVWVTKGDQVLRGVEGRLEKTTMSFERDGSTASDPIRHLFTSRWNDLWVSPAGKYRSHDGRLRLRPDPPTAISRVIPFADDPFGNLWGIEISSDDQLKGIVVRTFSAPDKWQSAARPAEWSGLTSADWVDGCCDEAGYIWLATRPWLVRLDPREPRDPLRLFRAKRGDAFTAIAAVSGRQVVLGTQLGELVEPPGRESYWVRRRLGQGKPIRGLYQDGRGMLWIAAASKLLRSTAWRPSWFQDWSERPPMPAGNHDHIFARIENRLYTAGGKTYFGWPASEWVNLDHIWSYDVKTHTWRFEAPMLESGKAYSGIATLGNELWLIGGLFRDGAGTKATATVEIYNPQTGQSRRGPSFPTPRGQVVALTSGSRLYAIGGGNRTGNSALMFSIAEGETAWRPEIAAPGPVVQASGCVFQGRLYVAAGPASNCRGLFVYDPQQRRWSEVSRPDGDTAPSAPLCCLYRNEIWVMGGRGPKAGRVRSDIYSPQTGKWRAGPPLPIPVSWGAAATVEGRLMIAGGAYRDDRVGNYFNSDRVFFLAR